MLELERIRIIVGIDNDRQKKNMQPFPKAYWFLVPIQLLAAGVLSLAFPTDISPLMAVYVGAAAPKIISQMTTWGDLARATLARPGESSGSSGGELTHDDTSPEPVEGDFYRSPGRVLHRGNGLYRFLTVL